MTVDAVLFALLIFALRVVNNAIGTIRVVMITRQQRALAAALGFFEAMIFALTMASIVTDLTNMLNMLAYCGGFSVGNYVGMLIEARFITSYKSVNIITQNFELPVAATLRAAGYGVTEMHGEGRDGEVRMLRSVVTHRDLPRLLDVVRTACPNAFVEVEEARSVHRGHVHAARVS